MEANVPASASVPSMAWALLGVAVLCEIAGAIGLRFAQGFTVLIPTVFALSAFTIALFLVSRVMKELPVSIAYPIWAGGGTAGVALLGIAVLGEQLTVMKAAGILFVMLGVVLVNLVTEKRSGC